MMTSWHTRMIAFAMAALLFLNTVVLPAAAEGSLDTPTVTDAPAVVTEAPTEAPTVPTQAPVEATEAPTEVPTEPEAPTTVTEAPTEAIGETDPSDPAEETGAPTEPTAETKPTEETEADEAALRAMQQEGYERAAAYYASLPVSGERNMPLEWWFMITGRASVREPDLSVLENGSNDVDPDAADASLGADWSAFVQYPAWITVSSPRDLILLSYVNPAQYTYRTIALLADADGKYDLTQPTVHNSGAEAGQELYYQGLGGLDYPFCGTLRFTVPENFEFILGSPLFIGLSCDAVFTNEQGENYTVSLTSRANFAFDGLLARHVAGETGMRADWFVRLNAPDTSDGSFCCLPSVLGVMYGNTDVHLTLTDNSDLEPSARGYLCATMYGNAALEAENITRTVYVPLVGEMSELATLLTDAPVNEPIGTEPVETEPFDPEPTETEPTETEPTETGTDNPDEEEQEYLELLEKAVAFYRTMPIVPGQMPLEWWYVFTGQAVPGSGESYLVIYGEDFLRFLAQSDTQDAATPMQEPTDTEADSSAQTDGKENTEPAQTEPAPKNNGAGSLADARVVPYADIYSEDISLYALNIPATGNISVHSLEDLVSLSYVDAARYQNRTIEFILNVGGVVQFNTTQSVTVDGAEMHYAGLGSDAAPFAGTILFPSSGSENVSFQLDAPLFTALSCTAVLPNLNLQSEAEVAVDALLAKSVYSGGSADWKVTLMAPVNASAKLPPLIGTIRAGADVTLTVVDNSGQIVSGSGYLCGIMEENSNLTARGLPSAITVEGGSSDTGSLVGSMDDNAALNLTLADSFAPTVTASGGNVGGLIGSMGSNTVLTISSTITANVNCSGTNAGGLVGSMRSGAGLNISSAPNITVTNSGGAAGGLVGNMSGGAALTLSSTIWIKKVEATTYAGGIAGVCENPEFTFADGALVSGTGATSMVYSSGGVAVGGIAGQLTWNLDKDEMALLPIHTLVMTNGDAGGLYGEIKNMGKALTFAYQGSLFTDVILEGRRGKGGAVGGLIGWLDGNGAASCTLTVKEGLTVEVTASRALYLGGLVGAPDNCTHIMNLSGNVILHGVKNATDVGGLIGISRRSQAKVEISNLTVKTDGFDSGSIGSYGGLFGELEDYGNYVYIGENVDLSGTTVVGTGNSGGLIGTMASGVLYMGENPQLPTVSTANNPNQRGWVIGNRNNSLVCAAQQWTHNAQAAAAYKMNDVNKWGQVLQLTAFDPGLIQLDRENRTVTIGALPGQTDGAYIIGSTTDFASVALRLQLSQKSSLIIPNDINNGASVSMKLTASISLEDTGLTGLTRDHSSCDLFHISLDGGGNSIMHPSMKVYTSSDAHNRQGLIARAGQLNLSNLIFTGTGNIEAISDETSTGIACYVDGGVVLTGVTSGVTWNFSGSAGGSKLSGMIAELTTDNKTITFENCTWNGAINDSTSGANHSAGFLAYLNKRGTTISVEDCTVSGQIIREASTGEAPVGGLISRIQGSDTTLNISNLNVAGAKINVKAPQNQWGDKCGGLLGFEWKDTDATFTGVTIKNSTLETDRKFGGLVYMGSGHWILTEDNGITFAGSTFSGTSDNGAPSGLLVSIGTNDPALYLEVLYNSFSDEGAAVTLSGQSSYFDSLMGKSINNGRTDAIVSISTARIAEGGLPLIDQDGCNTYRSELSKAYQNPCTRYDYNLCFHDKEAAGQIDTAGEMVLWSALCRANNSLDAYFENFIYQNEITGQIDLTGYAFYPVPFEGTRIENAVITFDFEQLERVEDGDNNKKPSDRMRQHAGMHTGIFTTVSGGDELSVNNLTLRGTIGSCNGNYGAIIRDSAQGANQTDLMTLSIQNVKLDGIRVSPTPDTAVAPLLINSIGSYTVLNMSGVKTVVGAYEENSKAASSLIGYVGNGTADYIQLNFSHMLLAESGQKNDACTLFTHALFLERFQYGGTNSRGVYNFERDDDYTLGREISNTEGGVVSGRNNGEQYWFFRENGKETGYVHLQTRPGSNRDTAFKDELRYVYIAEQGEITHEIDINLVSPDLLVGCGTYSHPYIISNGRQLEALSQAIVVGGKRSGWKVKVNDPVISAIKAGNCDFSQQHPHTGSGSAEENVLDNETVYTSGVTNWTASGKDDTVTDAQMLQYLLNAYYQIDQEITLTDWTGLGEEAISKQFSGVITGSAGAKIIISVCNSSTIKQFGGLVKFSRGSVIKDLSIEFRKPENGCLTITCSEAPSSTTNASFFGGVVGWCTSGDTVIDHVSVSYESGAVVAAGTMPYLAAMGGYVGLVGGANNLAGGGVIFRNVTSVPVGFSADYGHYSNAYIGRVMDGFALSESGGLGDLNSNYYIPDVSDAVLSINGSNATVHNGAGLWVLAAMINSSGGTRGKGRCGDYSLIGTVVTQDLLADEKPGSSLYLSKFSSGEFFTSDSLSLTLAGNCDVSGYGNGFRGIGADHGSNHRALKLLAADGNGHTITMAQNLFQYAEESNGWRLIAAGLFPDPSITTSNVTIENLFLSGSIAMYYWKLGNAESDSWDQPNTGVGMLIGNYMDNSTGATLTLSNVRAVDAEVSGNLLNIGGLVGRVMSHWGFTLKIENSGYENLTASGYANVGGLVGFVQCNNVQITNSSCTGGQIQLTHQFSWNDGTAIKYGVGGLAGNIITSSAVISSGDGLGSTFSGTNVISNIAYKKNEIGVGGLVGFWCIASGNSAAVENIRFSGNLTVSGAGVSSVGGLAGYICAQNDSGDWQRNSGGFNFSASNIYIAAEADSNITLTSGHQTGGLMGMYKSGAATTNAFTMDEIHIGAQNAQNVTVIGITSAASLVAALCKAPDVKVSNVFLNGNTLTADSYTALLFGAADNQTAVNLGLSIWNVEADGCTLNGGNSAKNSSKRNPGTGFLYGSRGSFGKGFTMDGYNILVKNSSITQNQNDNTSYPSNCAIWGGVNVDGKAVRLVAVCVQNCTTPTLDFASGASNCYAIRANYTNMQAVTSTKRPYVPSNPLSPLGTLDAETVTGDGASFAADGSPMGQKIYTEANAANCRTYFNVVDMAEYFKVNTGWVTDYVNGGNNQSADSAPANFPVLVVPADEQAAVTEEIFNYISLLTNQPFNASIWRARVSSLTVSTYRWTDGSFQALEKASLTLNSTSGKISVTKDCFDNERNQFTLLDIAFRNPTAGRETAGDYHLYIPVIVEKVLEFKLWASADVGTTYRTDVYDSLSAPAIGSHGEAITALIGVEYQRTPAQWQKVVDEGDNLLWGFKKTIKIDYGSGYQLPAGTMLTLVDRSNMDKAYFLSTNPGNEISFESFAGWQPTYLCDELKLTADANESGGYVLTDQASGDATVRIGKNYYRPYNSETDEGADRFSITVGLTEPLCEQYYVTILTPGGTQSIVNLVLGCGKRLTPADGAVGVPTKRIPTGQYDIPRNSSENQIILGNFFTQTVSVETTTLDRLISGSNNSISAMLNTSIEFTSPTAAGLFKQYGSNKRLFQRFDLYLLRCEKELETQARFASGTTLEVEYILNGTSVGTESRTLSSDASAKLSFSGDGIDVSQLGANTKLNLTASIKLTYADAGIIEQFPVGSSDDAKTGILVCVSSHLAYSRDTLAQSSTAISARDSKGNRYYRAEYGAATLYYVATGSTERSRLDQLGINGLEGTNFPVSSAAQYDVMALNTASDAAYLHCSVTLLRKNDAGSYIACSAPFEARIGAEAVSASGDAITHSPRIGADIRFPLEDGIDSSIPIQIPVELTLSTGNTLESSKNFYANYRVVLEAELLDSTGALIPGSSARDYIVYTNAKIVTSLINAG